LGIPFTNWLLESTPVIEHWLLMESICFRAHFQTVGFTTL